MTLALIRVKHDNRIVETKNIIEFDKYLKDPNANNLFILRENGRRVSCLILAVGESKEEIENVMKNKRLRYPVLNKSDLVDEEDLDESTNNEPEKEKHVQEAKETIQKKKKQKKNMEKGKAKSTKSIVEEFLETRRKEYDQEECGEHPHEKTEDSESSKNDETEQKQTKDVRKKKSRRSQNTAKQSLEVQRLCDQYQSEEEFENDQTKETSSGSRSSKNDETEQAGSKKHENEYEKLRNENKKLKAFIRDRFEIPEEKKK